MKSNGGIRHPRRAFIIILAVSLWVATIILLAMVPVSVVTHSPVGAHCVYAEEIEKEVEEVSIPETVEAEVVEPVETYTPSEEEILHAISYCESGHQQFRSDGSVVKNPGSSATGRWQIMASLWQALAVSLGYDIYTEEGNKSMARYILQVQGIQAWEASRVCLEKQGIAM